MQVIEGKTALVTGGARRLGRAVALELAAAGVHMVIHYRDSDTEAEATAAEARARGVNAITMAADLAVPNAATALFAHAVKAVGAIDILINNASIFEPSALLTFSEEELQSNLRLHAFAPLQLARALAATGRPGSIINLLDTRIARPDPAYAAYGLSKSMLAEITRMLALELAPRIRVNGIAPGLVLPPAGAGPGFTERRAALLPLQTSGEPDDISAAVLFLLRSSFITGQIIYIDGGSHLT
ncbi:MAG: SDR family oxidoreductase [Lentisphaerae bacterium]|nr:SDR family oxidoreductase [Lentisphaerota bacterium]